MLNYEKVKEYIEKKNKVELTFMQTQILKAIIRGDVIYTARGVGRSMLYDGYADYLKSVIAKDTDRTIKNTEYDSVFTFSMLSQDDIIKCSRFKEVAERLKNEIPDKYMRDFECKFQ
jgi:hypothetical protein